MTACSHQNANPSFHAILKFPRIVPVVSVVVVGVHKSINNLHGHNPMLEASMKDLSDEIVEKVSTKMDPSVLHIVTKIVDRHTCFFTCTLHM